MNGRLNDIDRAWMNSYLAENPKASLDVEIERSLKQALHDELPHFAADKGLNDFMARVRSEASTTQRPAFAESCKRFIQQCQAAVGSLFVSPRWAMAMTVLVAQAALIGVLISHRTTPIVTTQSEWRSVSSPSQYQGPVLQITFKPTATEEGIRLLLVQIGGSFLDGPWATWQLYRQSVGQ